MTVYNNHQGSIEHRQVKYDLLKWEPPPTNCYKLNVDATLFFNLAKVSYGTVVRDWKGTPLMAVSMANCHSVGLEIAKAIIILTGLQLCSHQDFESLIIESDNLFVV